MKPDDLAEFCRSFNMPDVMTVGTKRKPVGNKLNVLIADDHPDVVLLLRKITERYLPEAAIHEAINGVDTVIAVGTIHPAIDAARHHDARHGRPLPCCRNCCAGPELANSKVVVVSAYEPFDRVEELARLNPQIGPASASRSASKPSDARCRKSPKPSPPNRVKPSLPLLLPTMTRTMTPDAFRLCGA